MFHLLLLLSVQKMWSSFRVQLKRKSHVRYCLYIAGKAWNTEREREIGHTQTYMYTQSESNLYFRKFELNMTSLMSFVQFPKSGHT